MTERILVVDDERLIRWSVREHLIQKGYEVAEAETGAIAMRIAREQDLSLALLDLKLPDTDGVTLLKEIHALNPSLPVIIVTAYSTVENAVEAMKSGALDYVTKPFIMEELSLVVARAIEHSTLRSRVEAELRRAQAQFNLDTLIGESPQIQHVKELALKVAESDATTVLLLGESGVGKDLVAKAIHYASSRAKASFINLTCTAIPESLLEAELFGHERGGYAETPGVRKGLFELADGGTVFLDEIGDMTSALQAKVLRVLEDRAFRRVGGTQRVDVNVRVIAATNRDIEGLIRQGRFREDLYYRLSTFPIVIPPLRDRVEDIPVLAYHFLDQYNREFHRNVHEIAPAAIARLKAYAWPGNVRELRNVVERAALLATSGVLRQEDILLGRPSAAGDMGSVSGDAPLVRLPEKGCSLEEVERELVVQALARTSGNQTHAASLLGLTRDQIRYRLVKFQLDQ